MATYQAPLLGEPTSPYIGWPYRPQLVQPSWWDTHRQDIYNIVQAVVNASAGLFVNRNAIAQGQMQLYPMTGTERMPQYVFDQYAQEISVKFGVPLWKAKTILRQLLGDKAPQPGIPSWVWIVGAIGVGYFLYQRFKTT